MEKEIQAFRDLDLSKLPKTGINLNKKGYTKIAFERSYSGSKNEFFREKLLITKR
jgi:hypothetical protein